MPAGRILKKNGLFGRVTARPNKNLLQRRIIAAALTESATLLDLAGFSLDRENELTLRAIRAMGIAHLGVEGELTEIIGNMPFPRAAPDIEYAAYPGVPRLLLPTALLKCRGARFKGEMRLFAGELEPYLDQLTSYGAIVKRSSADLLIGGPLSSGRYVLPGAANAQWAGGLLFALPLSDGSSQIIFSGDIPSRYYFDLTLAVLREAGISVLTDERGGFALAGGQRYRSIRRPAEGDFSLAAFFLAAGALCGRVGVSGLAEPTAQRDGQIIGLLREFGADIRCEDEAVWAKAKNRYAMECDMSLFPDLLPLLAVLACAARGQSRFYHAGRLGLKECSRFAATIYELSALGAESEATEDGLLVRGAGHLRGGAVNARNDYRIALALCLASCLAKGEVILRGYGQLEEYAPEFWSQFCSLGGVARLAN